MQTCLPNTAATWAGRKSQYRKGFPLSICDLEGQTFLNLKIKAWSKIPFDHLEFEHILSYITGSGCRHVCNRTCCWGKIFTDKKKSQIPCKSTSPEISSQMAAAKLSKYLLSTALTTARSVGCTVPFRKGLQNAYSFDPSINNPLKITAYNSENSHLQQSTNGNWLI